MFVLTHTSHTFRTSETVVCYKCRGDGEITTGPYSFDDEAITLKCPVCGGDRVLAEERVSTYRRRPAPQTTDH